MNTKQKSRVKTMQKPRKKPRGKPLTGKEGKHYSREYQPSGEAKSLGKQMAKIGREMIREALEGNYNFARTSDVKRKLKTAFGNVEGINAGQAIVGQQIQKAVLDGDTNSAAFLFNQAYGMPKQPTEAIGEIVVTKKVISFKNAK